MKNDASDYDKQIYLIGDKWHHRRKLLTPTFHYKILDNFVPIMDEQSRQLVINLKSKVNQNAEIRKELYLSALDIICGKAKNLLASDPMQEYLCIGFNCALW